MTKQNTTKSFVAGLKCSNYSVAFQVSCHLWSEQISKKHIACLSETQSDNFYLNGRIQKFQLNKKRRQHKFKNQTSQDKSALFSWTQSLHSWNISCQNHFSLDALMFLYQCLQRIIMLLFLLNTPRCYQFKLEQTHIFKSTCEQKYSKTEAHTSNKNYGKEQTRISIF